MTDAMTSAVTHLENLSPPDLAPLNHDIAVLADRLWSLKAKGWTDHRICEELARFGILCQPETLEAELGKWRANSDQQARDALWKLIRRGQLEWTVPWGDLLPEQRERVNSIIEAGMSAYRASADNDSVLVLKSYCLAIMADMACHDSSETAWKVVDNGLHGFFDGERFAEESVVSFIDYAKAIIDAAPKFVRPAEPFLKSDAVCANKSEVLRCKDAGWTKEALHTIFCKEVVECSLGLFSNYTCTYSF